MTILSTISTLNSHHAAGFDVESDVLCAALCVLRILADLRSGESLSETPNT